MKSCQTYQPIQELIFYLSKHFFISKIFIFKSRPVSKVIEILFVAIKEAHEWYPEILIRVRPISNKIHRDNMPIYIVNRRIPTSLLLNYLK